MGGIFDDPEDEGAQTVERPAQRPMATNPSDYYETGRLNVGVGHDGLPVIGGERPMEPDEGWSDDNLVCEEADGRPVCKHFVTLLLPADGVARGHTEMRQIRRFCTKLATASELFEITDNVYACGARSPKDAKSDALLRNFVDRQKQMARDAAEKSGELDF